MPRGAYPHTESLPDSLCDEFWITYRLTKQILRDNAPLWPRAGKLTRAEVVIGRGLELKSVHQGFKRSSDNVARLAFYREILAECIELLHLVTTRHCLIALSFGARGQIAAKDGDGQQCNQDDPEFNSLHCPAVLSKREITHQH